MTSSKSNESSRKNSNDRALTVVAEAKIKPHERRSLLLGSFTLDALPIGFTFEAKPNMLESIVANISISDARVGKKYISFITNNADKPVNITVCQLQ